MRALLVAENGVHARLHGGGGHIRIDDDDLGAEIRDGGGGGGRRERCEEPGSAEAFEKRLTRVVQGWPPRYPLRNRRRVARTQSGSVTRLGQANPWLNRPHSIARNAVTVSRPAAGSAESGAPRAIAPLCRT